MKNLKNEKRDLKAYLVKAICDIAENQTRVNSGSIPEDIRAQFLPESGIEIFSIEEDIRAQFLPESGIEIFSIEEDLNYLE